MVRGSDGGVSVKRVEPWKEELFLAGTGLVVEDGVFEGLGGGAAPRTEGGEFAVEPGWVSGQVAFSRSHLVNSSSQELGKSHERVRG